MGPANWAKRAGKVAAWCVKTLYVAENQATRFHGLRCLLQFAADCSLRFEPTQFQVSAEMMVRCVFSCVQPCSAVFSCMKTIAPFALTLIMRRSPDIQWQRRESLMPEAVDDPSNVGHCRLHALHVNGVLAPVIPAGADCAYDCGLIRVVWVNKHHADMPWSLAAMFEVNGFHAGPVRG